MSSHSGTDIFSNAMNASDISEKGKNVVRHLLNPEPKKRLGSGIKGVEEIKDHPWLTEVNWKDLTQGRTAAPHAVFCTDKIQTNSDLGVEKEFFENAEDVPLDDCPDGLHAF